MELVCSGPLKTWESIERVAIEFHEDLRPGCCQMLQKALRERGFNNISISPTYAEKGQGIMQASR